MPVLHVQNRSVSTVKNIDRGVQVRVRSMATCRANKRRLVLAASAVHTPAGGAGLRGIGRVHFNQRATCIPQFIGQHGFDLMPTNVQNHPSKTTFLSNTDSRFCQSAFGRTGHIPGAQALNDNSPLKAVLAASLVLCLGRLDHLLELRVEEPVVPKRG